LRTEEARINKARVELDARKGTIHSSNSINFCADINQATWQSEFERLKKFIHPNYELEKKDNSKRKGMKNPVRHLSQTLEHYKKERIDSEHQLVKKLQKVHLDKSILFREKRGTLWKEIPRPTQTAFEDELRRQR
jgi:hypothetical protein